MSSYRPTQSVSSFYAGRSILVTGATGFIGKALIEKLMRSCPDVQEIFLLMRAKKGMSIDDRLKKMLSSPLYDKVRKENPKAFDKLIPVNGNTAEEGLGLGPVERSFLIERVSIIFHVAASVRFDDHLKDAIFANLRSTRDICILGKSMKKLVALIHVSSTYTQADKPVVEEIVYPVDIDWRKTIKIAESVDDEVLKTFTIKYMGSMLNTYTFTKRLAEQVIYDYSKELPCVIARPSIVVHTVQEPVEGWLDNFNGPTGLMVGGGKGICRITYMRNEVISDFIPVDVTVKILLLTAWKRGLVTVTKDPSVHVYNCASAMIKGISMAQLIKIGLSVLDEVPLDGAIWWPNNVQTSNKTVYFILMVLWQLLPALIIDGILKLSGRRPMLVTLQRKIYTANSFLAYFVFNQWKFCNEKALALLNEVPEYDREDFYIDITNISPDKFFKHGIIGAKLYLLNEDLNDIPKALRHRMKLYWIDLFTKILLIGLFIFVIYYRCIYSYITNS